MDFVHADAAVAAKKRLAPTTTPQRYVFMVPRKLLPHRETTIPANPATRGRKRGKRAGRGNPPTDHYL
jgi:hypothetical protein